MAPTDERRKQIISVPPVNSVTFSVRLIFGRTAEGAGSGSDIAAKAHEQAICEVEKSKLLVSNKGTRDERFVAKYFLRYLQCVEVAPFESRKSDVIARLRHPAPEVDDSGVIEDLWGKADAAAYGLSFEEFTKIFVAVGTSANYGLAAGHRASYRQQAAFFAKLWLSDLALARACAMGKAAAWEHFLAVYRHPLVRAAVKITRNETLGHDLAEDLSSELYGLTVRDGQRSSSFNSYMGTGRLTGWLSTLLAQRNVDYYRRNHRETSLDDYDAPAPTSEAEVSDIERMALGKALKMAFDKRDSEDRYLLKAYYLDGRTLRQISELLDVHESTISRRIIRLIDNLRKQVLLNLQVLGLNKQEAKEALGTDPRDVEINLMKLLQKPEPGASSRKVDR